MRFLQGDVLAQKHVLSEAFREALARPPRGEGGRRLLVSNLPYNVATPILLGLLSMEAPPERVVAMIQREVAEKMLAKPGTRNYGVPSIHVGLKAEGRILRRFGPSVFWPRPKVDSAVIELIPRPGGVEPDQTRPFSDFVTALFTRRRKVLPTALAHAASLPAADARAIVEEAGFAPTARVQELTPDAVLALFRRTRGV